MSLMDMLYILTGGLGVVVGAGIAWGSHRNEIRALRRDVDRLREDLRDGQRRLDEAVQQLFILRVKNGHYKPSDDG